VVQGKLHGFKLSGMVEIIKMLYTREEKKLIDYLFNVERQSNKIEIDLTRYDKAEYHVHNLLSKFIFVVSDLNAFLDQIKKLDLVVNQGPQKLRGRLSIVNNIISSFDKGFRDSLYLHNRQFKGVHPYIPRHKFTFNNIHVNTGNVR
jgi:hypothetical protein